MIERVVPALIALLTLSPASAAAASWQERPNWAQFFERAGTDAHLVYGAERAQTRFMPASTFKIAHALFALGAGMVRDEFQIFRWDGTKRDIESWNHDQDLRSSMRNSAVWVYQQLARELGEERERHYLSKISYGNADRSGGVDTFWLRGNLRISAEEQVALLQRPYRNELPFRVEHQRLVKDVMIVEAGRNWILRAKAGWQARVQPQVGWWVGWVEWREGPGFFAINIEMPKGAEALPQHAPRA
jgi:beta-lactamase class D